MKTVFLQGTEKLVERCACPLRQVSLSWILCWAHNSWKSLQCSWPFYEVLKVLTTCHYAT